MEAESREAIMERFSNALAASYKEGGRAESEESSKGISHSMYPQ